MTEEELDSLKAFALKVDLQEMAALVDQVQLLRATIEQQAAWLREITTERDALKLAYTEQGDGLDDLEILYEQVIKERDALKLRVAELEQRAPAGYHPDDDPWTGVVGFFTE